MVDFNELVEDYSRHEVPEVKTVTGWHIGLIMIGVAITHWLQKKGYFAEYPVVLQLWAWLNWPRPGTTRGNPSSPFWQTLVSVISALMSGGIPIADV